MPVETEYCSANSHRELVSDFFSLYFYCKIEVKCFYSKIAVVGQLKELLLEMRLPKKGTHQIYLLKIQLTE